MSTLALNFFATAPTTTIETNVAPPKPYTAGKFDGLMMVILMVVIGATSTANMANLAEVDAGINSYTTWIANQ